MENRGNTRRLMAILAADVVEYSRLMHEDEETTIAAWQSARHDIIDPMIAAHDGRIVKHTGDGFLAEFATVTPSVKCAVELQAQLSQSPLDFRIGINLCEIVADEDDIHGDGVNIAARLEGLADPGGICISGAVYDQVSGKISQTFEFMGEQMLKNIKAPVRAYRVLIPEGVATTPTKESSSSPLDFAPPDKPSIAIMPFKSLGNDPDQDFLADGIRFGIQATLVQLSGLFLVNAPAMNAYRETDVSAGSVGTELGVRYVLEGAVQQAGDRVRITVHLIDVNTRQAVWAESYDRVLDDIFVMQDEITQEVISSLNIKLVVGEEGRIWFNKLTSPKARECYYRGSSHLYAGTKEDNAIARGLFEELYRIHPDAVQGPSNIAVTHWIDAFFGWTDSSARSLEQAATWAEIATQYEDNNGIGHAVLGHIQLLEQKYDEAIATCSKGVELRGSCPLAHGLLGLVLHYCGDAQSAVKSIREALQIDKVYATWMIDVLAAAYRDCGEVDLSIPVAKESIRIDPKNNEARLILCSNYKLSANHDQAQLIADEIITNNPTFSLSAYAKSQPYKDTAMLNSLIATLRDSGLPE